MGYVGFLEGRDIQVLRSAAMRISLHASLKDSLSLHQVSHAKKNSYFPLYWWLFNKILLLANYILLYIIPIRLGSIIPQNQPKQPGALFSLLKWALFRLHEIWPTLRNRGVWICFSGVFGGPQNDPPGGNRILREASNFTKKKTHQLWSDPSKKTGNCSWFLRSVYKSACNFFMLSMCVAFISKIFSSTSLPLGITAPFARRCSSKAVLGDQRDLGSVILLLVALRISQDLKSLVVWRSKRTLRNTGSFTLQLYGLMIFYGSMMFLTPFGTREYVWKEIWGSQHFSSGIRL